MFNPHCLNNRTRCIFLLLCLVLVLSLPAAGQANPAADELVLPQIYLPLLSRGYVPYQESSGTLDTNFDGDGRVLTDLNETGDYGIAMVLQPDGRLLVGGEVEEDFGDYQVVDLAVARYNRDGSLDPSFSGDGWVRTDLDGWDDFASAIAVQPDGKVLLAGTSKSDFALVRYTSDGSLDTTFDGDGWVRTDIFVYSADESKAVAVQPDGCIIVAGYATNSNGDYDFALVRYLAHGSLDPSFGDDGRVTTDLTGDQDKGRALIIQPDGKIILAGPAKKNFHDFAVARYLPDGSLDPSFGTGGWVFTDFDGGHDFAYAVALQMDGRILVAGTADIDGQDDIALARYTANGLLDISFGEDGRVTTDFAAGDDYAYGLALQPDGKVIAAGYAFNGLNFDFAVLRYTPNGSLDTSFAADGAVVTDFAGGDDLGLAVVLQPDGMIVVAGNAFNGLNTDFALVRYK